MKTMTNIQKVILLVNSLDRYGKPECLKVKDGKLYHATWDVDYHNGDIDNYAERLMKEPEAGRWIDDLERKYAEQEWEKYVEMEKKSLVQQLYVFSPKVHDLNENRRSK